VVFGGYRYGMIAPGFMMDIFWVVAEKILGSQFLQNFGEGGVELIKALGVEDPDKPTSNGH
jgi:hypothetical protein